MYNQQLAEEYEWKECANGNYVCIHSDALVATVFMKDCEWKIIINGEGVVSHIVAYEAFEGAAGAIERAEQVLGGADCDLVAMLPRNASTNWKQQKAVSNGSPTYGRKQDGVGVSVKKAKSGKWFYIEHGSPPQGWFDSAEEAMKAFDAKHR